MHQRLEPLSITHRVRAGLASEEERREFLLLARVNRIPGDFRALVESLCSDESEDIRPLALMVLVLRMQCRDSAAADICWLRLEDSDDYVRLAAAGCLGSIYFNSQSVEIAERLATAINRWTGDSILQWAIFDAIRSVTGHRPTLEDIIGDPDKEAESPPDPEEIEQLLTQLREAGSIQ